MKNTSFKLFVGLIFSSLLMISCQSDPWDIVDEHTFHERDILEVKLGISTKGAPIITRDETGASVEVFFLAPADFDLTAIPVNHVAISYGATTSATPGSTLNFDNPELKSTIKVTSEAGQSLDWDIYLKEIPVNYAEMKNQAINGGEWWWIYYFPAVEWKETFNISSYWIDDPNENIDGTRNGTNIRPAWADAVLDNTLTMTPDGKFTVNPGADGELGGPVVGNYNVLNFASGRFFYQINENVVNFIDDATGAEQQWIVRTDLIPDVRVAFVLGQEATQGAGSTTLLELE